MRLDPVAAQRSHDAERVFLEDGPDGRAMRRPGVEATALRAGRKRWPCSTVYRICPAVPTHGIVAPRHEPGSEFRAAVAVRDHPRIRLRSSAVRPRTSTRTSQLSEFLSAVGALPRGVRAS